MIIDSPKAKPNIKILVACHKADPNIRQDEIYLPVQVGKDLHPDLELGFQCDNTGDNISEKNGSYCELTAIYWAWKNLKNVDYIGLCHYRRYFDYEININNLKKDLEKYDVIAIKQKITPHSAEDALSSILTREDLAIAILDLIKLNKNKERDIIDYFYKNNKLSRFNMFIMKWESFDRYCSSLFSFLDILENDIKPLPYNRLKRAIGYIAEGFQGIFFKINNFKVKFVDPVILDGHYSNKLKGSLRKFRDNLIFSTLSKPNKVKIWSSVKVGLKQDGYAFDELQK